MTGSTGSRPVLLSTIKLLVFAIGNLSFARAFPTARSSPVSTADGKPVGDPGLWIYLGTAVALVLLGGAFAGLTIACVLLDVSNSAWLIF